MASFITLPNEIIQYIFGFVINDWFYENEDFAYDIRKQGFLFFVCDTKRCFSTDTYCRTASNLSTLSLIHPKIRKILKKCCGFNCNDYRNHFYFKRSLFLFIRDKS